MIVELKRARANSDYGLIDFHFGTTHAESFADPLKILREKGAREL